MSMYLLYMHLDHMYRQEPSHHLINPAAQTSTGASERDTLQTFPMSHHANHPGPPYEDVGRTDSKNRQRIAVAVN